MVSISASVAAANLERNPDNFIDHECARVQLFRQANARMRTEMSVAGRLRWRIVDGEAIILCRNSVFLLSLNHRGTSYDINHSKILISVIVITAATEIGKRDNWLSAPLISLALTSLLAFIFVYYESGNVVQVASLSRNIFYLVLPSLGLFLVFPFALD